jgi:hypothetical protein
MRNKLIILSFALALSGASLAQGTTSNELDQNAQINIYPNPAVEYIIVELDGELTNADFELNSMIGNKLHIRPEEMGFGKYKISVKDLASGYYFLIIKDEDKRFKKAYKFLKN